MSVGRQWARFLIVGAMGVVLTLVITVLAHELASLPENVSFAVALVCIFAFHFFANALWVFRANAGWQTLLRYVISAVAFRILEYVFFTAMFVLVDLHYAIAVAAALVGSVVAKFFFYRSYVFRASASAPKAAENVVPRSATRS